MTEKRVPTYLQAVWELASQALEAAQVIIVVGYSLPPYDQAVLELLRSANRTASFHVFDPNELVPEAYESLLQRQILAHPGLPSGTRDLDVILEGIA
jgi:uncharacterized protein (DUF3084 family)